MRVSFSSLWRWLLLPLLAWRLVQCQGDASIVLDSESFQPFIYDQPIVIVLFYAPWCSISREFLPIYDETASSSAIPLAKVDCVQHEDIYAMNSIESFPTIKAFVYGNPVNYESAFTAEGLSEFIQRILSSGASRLESEGDEEVSGYEAFVSKHLEEGGKKAVAIAFADSPDTLIAFDFACIKANILPCALSEDPETATSLGLPFPSIHLHRSFAHEESLVFASPQDMSSQENLLSWFYLQAFPQIIPFNAENEELIFSSSRPGYSTHIVVIGDASSPNVATLLSAMRSIHANYFDKCVFIHIDTADESPYVTHILNDVQVPRNTPGTVMGIRTLTTKVDFSLMSLDMNAMGEKSALEESLSSWIESVIGGRAELVRTVSTA